VRLNALLTGYLAGVSTLAEFPTLPDELLYRRPAEDAWSAAEVIHHLADAEVFYSVVYRRVLLERQPSLEAWDDQRASGAMHYRERALINAVGTITALRHDNVDMFAALSPAQWRRTAIHPDQGSMSLRELVLMATDYLGDRLSQARRAVNGVP